MYPDGPSSPWVTTVNDLLFFLLEVVEMIGHSRTERKSESESYHVAMTRHVKEGDTKDNLLGSSVHG